MSEQQTGTAVREKVGFREEYKEPRRYKVYVLNDDYTTFDFVVYLMVTVFSKTADEGWRIAHKTHNEGKGYVGTYSYDMAKTKTTRATSLSRSYGFPLDFSITPENEDGE